VERLAAWAQLISLAIVGVVAGIFVATQVGQVRVQKTLNARDFTLVKHAFEVAMGRIMPVLTIAAGLSIIPVAIAADSQATRALAVAALALWVGVIVVTLVFNAPINAEAAKWDPASPPRDWADKRRRWHLGQTIRTPLAVGSFLCVALATQWDRLSA
jgi:uncharacterized membrane protein